MTNTCRCTLVLGSMLGALMIPLDAWADKGYYPNFGMDYTAVLQFDQVRADGASPGAPRTTTDFYPDIQASFYLRLSPDDQLRTSVEYNPADPPSDGQHRRFGDLGLVFNELNYYRLTEHTEWQVGKLQVPFGRAMDAAPGLYSNDFVAAYDLGGMLGGTFSYRYFGQRLGMLQGGVTVYTADNSQLGRTLLRPGSRLQRADGGPANSGKLDSHALTLNWIAIPALPYLELQAGYMRNAAGADQPDTAPARDEIIRVASARYIWAPQSAADLGTTLRGRYLDIVPFVEVADVDNENAVAGNDTRYLTTSLTVDYGRWALGATRTDKRRPWAAGAGRHDYLDELSCTYRLTGLLSIGASIGNQRQGAQRDDLVGLTLSYTGAY